MTNYREILRLHSLGINNTQAAESCGCSRTTIVSTLRRAKECGLNHPLKEGMSDRDLAELLFPPSVEKPVYKMPDCEYMHREMAKSGVTLSLLWVEYCDECREASEIPYQSTQFNKYYRDFVRTTKATMHINHKPGEIMEVDWSGDAAHIVDTDTGELINAYVFVAVVPYSGYSYVEAFLAQNQECWTAAHVNAFNYFGGVTRILVPDNLKTGVEKATRTETIINKTYQELAEHYGTAVIPCRVRSPKDKATVEGSVGIISTWIIAALRNQQFLSLNELNEAIREKLTEFNSKPFQKKDGSRAVAFQEEKMFLLPLPQRPFELSSWKVSTVMYNYHISINGHNYSVPYEYIKQKVDVRISKNVIEVLYQGNRISSHPRLYGRNGQYSTIEAHMPPDHQKYVQWNGERFLGWAAKIGEMTSSVVRYFLNSHKVEQQGYKVCMALLKLADKYSVERIEAACAKALSYTPQPSLKSIQSILKSGRDKTGEETVHTSAEASQYSFTRGAGYYRSRRVD